jgi:hypothetical protein
MNYADNWSSLALWPLLAIALIRILRTWRWHSSPYKNRRLPADDAYQSLLNKSGDVVVRRRNVLPSYSHRCAKRDVGRML